jgi:hypothetical protein
MLRRAVLACMLMSRVLITHTVPASAQAWVQPEHGTYVKLTTSYLFSRQEFNYRGERQPVFADKIVAQDTWFRDISVMVYVEHGVADNLTLVASAPFKYLTTAETIGVNEQLRITRELGAPADLTLLLRQPLVRGGPFALSIQYGGWIPLGYEAKPANGAPALGTGKLQGEVGLYGGWSFYPTPAYTSAGFAYRRRQGALHDEVFYNIETGVTPGRFFGKLRFDGLQNVEDPPDLALVDQDAVVGDQEIFQLSGEVNYRFFGGVAVTLEFFHTFAGKNTIAGTKYAAGLVWQR